MLLLVFNCRQQHTGKWRALSYILPSCLLALVELRGRRGLVEQTWDLSVSSSQSLLLEQELIQEARRNCQEDQACQLVAMAVCGRIRKVSLSQL